MDDAADRALQTLYMHVQALQAHVEILWSTVEALIRMVPPERQQRLEHLQSEIHARFEKAGALAEANERLRQAFQGDDNREH